MQAFAGLFFVCLSKEEYVTHLVFFFGVLGLDRKVSLRSCPIQCEGAV